MKIDGYIKPLNIRTSIRLHPDYMKLAWVAFMPYFDDREMFESFVKQLGKNCIERGLGSQELKLGIRRKLMEMRGDYNE